MITILTNFIAGETETTRINHIVQQGAASRLTDLQFLAAEIQSWKRSRTRRVQITGERYYAGEHHIKQHFRHVIGASGKPEKVDNLPNNRIVDNQYAKMVDQKVNYSFGKPFSFKTDNKEYAEVLRKRAFDFQFYRTFRYLAEDCLNGGIGWLYVYYDDKGVLRFRRFESYEVLPFWRDAAHTELDAVLRLYEVELYEGVNKRIQEHVEVYTPEGVYCYILNNGTLEPEETAFLPYVTVGADPLKWERLPVIPFKRNNKEQPLIEAVKSLQDGINLMLSTFANGMEEDPRNSILVLVNYDGENLGEFRQKLAAYGAVKVRNTADTPGGDVKTLTVEVNSENYKAILETFKKALIENARGYDAKDDRLSGNPNQMNIMSMYSDIDLDANSLEGEFRVSFEQLLWFVNAYLANAGYGDFTQEEITISFNRNVLMNNVELIDMCQKSEGQVSRKTILSKHPFVEDVDAELEQMKKEQQEAQEDMYGGVFHAHDGVSNEE